jgi:hypothetical protein
MVAMKTLSFLSLTLSLIAGFHIPANTTNGVYKAYYDKDGKEVHVLLTPEILANDTATVFAANLVALPSMVTSPVVRRTAYRRSFCECNQNLDHSDADAATEMLRDQIQRAGGTVYVPINQGIYGTLNGVTAFICTPERNSAVTPVNVVDYNYALRWITDHCGRYVPGMYIHGDMNGENMNQHAAAEDMGYKNNKYGDTWVCEHAEDPQSENC